VNAKGKIAWLITWEGSESEHYGRCKVVTILRPQFGTKGIATLPPVLFSSEYNFTLCEKMGIATLNGREFFLKEAYRDVNPELWYGLIPKIYLRARRVKNLRCQENKKDCFENTLYWTELPKFIPNPQYGPEGPPLETSCDALKQVADEKEAQYTYSIRPSIESEKARRALRKTGEE
jgi:hypothetical protein